MSDPGTKYADKVDPQFKMAMEAIGFFRQMLGQHRGEFEKLLKAKNDMDNFGGLLDPTLYRDMIYSKQFKQNLRLVRAALTFLDEIDAVAAEVEGRPNA